MQDDEFEPFLADARGIIRIAKARGLLTEPDKGVVGETDALVRLEMLSQALRHLRLGAFFCQGVNHNWEYARSFGYLVRLAIFEMGASASEVGWRRFRDLFRHYFGQAVDPYLPSVFLAAISHPAILASSIGLTEARRFFEAAVPEETLYESARSDGRFD